MFKTFWPSAYLVSLNDGNTFEYRLRLAAPAFNINCFLSLSAFLGLLSGGCCGNKAWMSLFRCFGVINTAVLDKKKLALSSRMDLSQPLRLLFLLFYVIFKARFITFKTAKVKMAFWKQRRLMWYQLDVGLFVLMSNKEKLKCAIDISTQR